MKPKIARSQDVVIFAPEGELDTHNSPELRESLLQEMKGGSTKILVDLSRVGYMDSAALGALVYGYKRAREMNVQFKISSVRGPVAKIFQLTRLNKFFDIYQNSNEALASFR